MFFDPEFDPEKVPGIGQLFLVSMNSSEDSRKKHDEIVDSIYDPASSTEIVKSKFRSLSEELHRDASEICRIVARLEAGKKESNIQPVVDDLRSIFTQWRG